MSPNDPKLSDGGVRRGTCMAGGKAAAEAGAVTHGAVRCSAWLGVAVISVEGLGRELKSFRWLLRVVAQSELLIVVAEVPERDDTNSVLPVGGL